MKKTLILLMILLMLLSGCQSEQQTEAYTYDELKKVIGEAAIVQLPAASYNNAVKEYYSYYLPRGVGREERDATSNLFNIYGNKAILNIDIASIIADEYYDGGDDSMSHQLRNIDIFSQTEFVTHGIFNNSDKKGVMYRIYVKSIDDNMDYILMQDNYFLFASTCYKVQTKDMLYEMIKILRSCSIDDDKIVSVYSNVSNTEKKTSIISLFKEILPESGYVADYIDDWKEDPSFVIIDNSHKDEEDPADIIDNPDYNNENSDFVDPEDGDNNENR